MYRWWKTFRGEPADSQPELVINEGSNDVFQASLLVQASMTRTRIHEVAIGMTLSHATLDHLSLVEKAIRNSGIAVKCHEVDEDDNCIIWTPEEAAETKPEESVASGKMDGGAKFLKEHLAGVPDVANLDRSQKHSATEKTSVAVEKRGIRA